MKYFVLKCPKCGVIQVKIADPTDSINCSFCGFKVNNLDKAVLLETTNLRRVKDFWENRSEANSQS